MADKYRPDWRVVATSSGLSHLHYCIPAVVINGRRVWPNLRLAVSYTDLELATERRIAVSYEDSVTLRNFSSTHRVVTRPERKSSCWSTRL